MNKKGDIKVKRPHTCPVVYLQNFSNRVYGEIVNAFKAKDCQAAAVLIGALMHIVADATYYAHVLEGEVVHESFKNHVFHSTYKTWIDAGYDRTNEFFNLAEATGKLTAADMFNPYQATLRAAKDTRFGNPLPLLMDAEFLNYSAPTPQHRQFWGDLGWISHQQQHSWTHALRPSGGFTSIQKYFDTVEHNLNQAVYYCATVLNYILKFAKYTDCDCGDSGIGGQYPPDPTGQKDAIKEGLKLTMEQFESLFYFNFMGLLATAIALALINKVEILEALIPV